MAYLKTDQKSIYVPTREMQTNMLPHNHKNETVNDPKKTDEPVANQDRDRDRLKRVRQCKRRWCSTKWHLVRMAEESPNIAMTSFSLGRWNAAVRTRPCKWNKIIFGTYVSSEVCRSKTDRSTCGQGESFICVGARNQYEFEKFNYQFLYWFFNDLYQILIWNFITGLIR